MLEVSLAGPLGLASSGVERRRLWVEAARRDGREEPLDVIVCPLELQVVHSEQMLEAAAAVVRAGAAVEIDQGLGCAGHASVVD